MKTVLTTPESWYDLQPAYAFAMRSSTSWAFSACGLGSSPLSGSTTVAEMRQQAASVRTETTTRMNHLLLTPNIIFELTGRSAYHRPISVFPGQHIAGR